MTAKNRIPFYIGKLSTRINKKFIPMWYDESRVQIYWGSRNSSKSDFVAFRVMCRMLTDTYFKGVAIRLVADTHRDSTWETMVQVIERWNLKAYFTTTVKPMKIVCNLNGNVLLFRGMDKPGKIRSLKDPSFCWWEEELPETESDWNMVSNTLRSSKAQIIQEVFTLNPIIPNYKDHWFYQKFFSHTNELDFEITTNIEIDGEKHPINTKVHHSTYKDNRWCGLAAKIKYESITNTYDYQTQVLGLWADEIIEGRYFGQFSDIHIKDMKYDPDKPLHISFDFNRRPYSAATIFQVYGKEVYQIDEICTLNKDIKASPLDQTCIEFSRRYSSHKEGIYVYGDPAGKNEGATKEMDHNDFSIIMDNLKSFNPKLRMLSKAPALKTNGEWHNEIFLNGWQSIKLNISNNCKNTIQDMRYLMIDKEGGTFKPKIKDKDGVPVEKYGHCSDSLRYFMTAYFDKEWNMYLNRHKTSIIQGSEPFNDEW